MKKLNKLCAILFAVLGVQTLSAQTNIIADWDGGSNTGQPTTFGWVSSYGSRNWGELNGGGGARVTNSYSGYKKEDGSTYSYVADSEPSTQILWIRYNSTSETYTYTFQGLEAGKVYRFSGLVGWHNNSNAPTFTIKVNGDKELAKVTKYCGTKQTMYSFSVDFMVPADNQSENFTLTFNSNQANDNMEALSALSIVENTDIENATEASPYDMTSWLKNPGFENGPSSTNAVNAPTDWKVTYDLAGWLDGNPNTTNPSEGTKCYNLWAGTVNSIDMYQTLYLPAGKYRVSADLRTDNVNNITNQGVYANVGGVITKSGTIQTVASTWNSLEGWNTLTATFNNGSAGEVTLGISSTGNGGSSGWFQADNVRLEYLGFDLTEANEALNDLITLAQEKIGANQAAPVTLTNLSTAIEAAQNVEQTKEAIEAASANLTNYMALADATIEACDEYRNYIALSESMLEHSTADDKSTFQNAINTAKTNFNTAADADAVRAISAGLVAAQQAYCLVASPEEGYPFDMTHLVVNPTFDVNTEGWNHNTGASNYGRATNQSGAITGGFYENWDWNSYTGEIYQEITGLPNGRYVLTAAAFRDQLIDNGVDADAVYVFANGEATLVSSATPALYSVEVSVNTGTLRFGVRSNTKLYRWMGIDNVTLKFVSGLDLSEFVAAYETALAAAIAARDNVEYESVTGLERTNLVQAIDATREETKEWYQSATTALSTSTSAFTAAKGAYDTLNAEKTIALGLGMTSDQISDVTNGKTGDAAYNDLKVAEYNYIQDTYTENVTLGSWTEDFASDLDGEGYKAGGPKYLDDWQGNQTTRTTKQTVTLPAGDYALFVIARGSAGASGNLYYKIGDVTTDIALIMKGNRGRGVDVNGVANFSEEGEYNSNGEGFGWEYRFITFHLDTETQVEIGASVTIQGQWASVYAPVLYTTEASQKVLLLDEINTLLSNVPSGKMQTAVATALESAVAEAGTVSDASDLSTLSSVAADLRTAVNEANASIADYALIKTYIDKADGISTSIAAEYTTQYNDGTLAETAVAVFQNLEVATYNYVTANFNYNVALSSDWNKEGPVGELSDQHWSGENRPYMEQSGAAWGQNAWSIKYDQDLTLPAGEYVFKVAGRKASGNGCTLNLTVTSGGNVLGTVNDFPEGDQGYGIDTSGAANFSEEGTYANNDNGRGWQWRYVKFTLANEATVNIAVNAEATTNHQWISFCDATVQMTEETYLEANMGGLDAPTAAANALVDSKPMGTAQNQALKDALDLPVTTGAELLAKIDALNAAVANANTWIADYNTAKAPLVAALERFETDYNDAENGALDYMCKSRWTTAVDMAQAAAVAKDVTDSYEGFATAAEELNTALDAATVSIGEYSNLKAAIDEANTLYGGNDWGDEPFQKPESAKDGLNTAKAEAQAAYDAAEVDGEGVTAVIESLNTNISAVVLNAPEEGQRFYIKVATEGHAKEGNAILATLGATSANNPTGYGLNTDNVAKGYLAQAFIFTQVEGNLYNISIERPEGTVYLTYGSLNESAAGWKNQQIQATTDAEKKGEFKIVPTGKNGILKIFNTVDNNYIDCQGGGAIYTDTGIENEEFAFELATEHSVTLSVSSAGWATLILPFNAEIPEGVTVYGSDMIDGDLLKLSEAESIVANTPYLVNGTEGTYYFSGYGLADKNSYKDANGFVGTYVDYATKVGDYVLQKQGNAVAFYIVGESAQPTVKPYRCYLTAPASEIKAFFIFDDGATGINGVDAADAEIEAIYTVNGVKVNSLQKGLNIVKMSNGKTQKVFVK